jgi:serine protease AprX
MAALVALLGAASLCFGQHLKLSPDLERQDPEAQVNVIIQYKQTPQQRHVDAVLRKGGRHLGMLKVVKGAVYSVAAKNLAELANDPDVKYISPDRTVRATSSQSSQLSPDYKLQAVGASTAQLNGYNGAGIGVAIIDSGITNKQDLHGGSSSSTSSATSSSFSSGYRVVHSENILTGGWSTDDTFGHGTHVAGIVAGDGSQSYGVYSGVAPAANLINLVVLNNSGSSTDSIVIAGIERAIQLQSQYNIQVINLSLGRPIFESYTNDPLCQAVEAAWQAGIVVVVAAGNDGRDNSQGTDGYATITAPGNDPYVITVGAMNTENTQTTSDDQIASYSSKGPTLLDQVVKPDLVAPGNLIVSVLGDGTLPLLYPQNITDKNYFILSGTSMAAPMVSGAAALLLQQNPNLTPDQVKARLMKTAGNNNFPVSSVATDPTTGISYTSYYDIFTVGAGYLNVWAALNSSAMAWGTALSPIANYNPVTGAVTISNIAGQSVIWGTSGAWANSVIWGTSVVSGNSVIWGTNIIWGTSAPSSLNIIWGTSLIWGTSGPADQTSTLVVDSDQ